MNSATRVITLIAVGALLTLIGLQSTAFAYSSELRRYPYMTDVVDNSATVNWATDRSATQGEVRWGIAGTESCTAHAAPAVRTAISVNGVLQYQWKATFNVAADTEYCYRVFLGTPGIDLLDTDPSPQFRSQLPVGDTTPYSFAVFGDWGEVLNADGTNPHQANLFSQVANSGARFAVTTGDNAYGQGAQSEYGDLQQSGANMSGVFGPNFWTQAGDSIPLFPALGNHGHSNTSHLVNWPQDAAVASSNGRYTEDTYCCLNGTQSKQYPSAWYAFDAGAARFYVLDSAWSNSNVGTADTYKNDYDYHFAPGTPQWEWLTNDLATHPRTLKFAISHFPLYSDQADEHSDPWLQGPDSLEGLLNQYGVNMAFNGHGHIYQRSTKPAGGGGVVSYSTGGGGAHLQPVGGHGCSPNDAYAIGWSYSANGGLGAGSACGAATPPVSQDRVHHFLLVSVNGTTVTVTPTDEFGRVFDQITYTPPSNDLSITKSDSPDPAAPGETLTYTLTASNLGGAAATGVTVSDVLPAGVTYQGATPSQGVCGEASGIVTCQLGGLDSGASATVAINVVPEIEGTIENSASVTGEEPDPNTDNNTANASTLVRAAADLSIAQTDSPDPVAPGEALTYTLTATNSGPSPGTGVTVTDTLPAGVMFHSATPSQGTCNEASGTLTCELGTIASGAAPTIELEVMPETEGTIVNEASIDGNDLDPDPSDNTSSAQTTVAPVADLSVTKDDSRDPVALGRTVNYTMTVGNDGPSDATGVTLTDNLPTGMTLQTVTPSQGSCMTPPPGPPPTFTSVADAYVDANTPTQNFGLSNRLRTDASPDVRSYLRFTPSGLPGTITNATLRVFAYSTNSVGYQVRGVSDNTWGETTINYNNTPAIGPVVASSGPMTANSWTETDVTSLMAGNAPLSLALTSTSATQASLGSRESIGTAPQLVVTVQPPGVVTCDLGTIASGENATVDVELLAETAGTKTNNVTVDADEHDRDAANNSASEQTTVQPGADLALLKTDSADPVGVGQSFTYTATVANSGPEAATGVTLTDTLPAGVGYEGATSSQGTCNESSGSVSCSLGTLGVGESATVNIAVTARTAGMVTNNASVQADDADPNEADNSASQDTTILPAADLSVTKTDSIDPVAVGQAFTYTATVSNDGPDDATGVALTDNLPAGVTYDSATPSQGTCDEASGTVTCDLGSLASSAGATVEISVTAQDTGTITNTVSLDGTEIDLDNSNNSASEDTTVRPGADLSVTKTDSADPTLVGEPLTYTATVTNSGPEGNTNVTLTDVLPAAVAYGSATPSQGTCDEASGTVTCDLGSVADGASATVDIAVTPQSTGTILNSVSVDGSEPDPDAADRSATQETTVVAGADLSVAQTDSPDPVLTDHQVTYTATVSNDGPDDATGVALTDNLPAGVTYGSATPSQGTCDEASGTVTCDLGSLASGANATVELTLTPQSAGTVTNEFGVDAAELDSDDSNNSSSESTTVTDGADLSVTQVDSQDPLLGGDSLTYAVTVANAGPETATNVALTDTLPEGAIYDSAIPSQGTCNESSGTVTCDLGSLANGESATVDVTVTPQIAGTITNVAGVASDLDPQSSNDSSSENTSVIGRADLSIAKTDSPDPVLTGHQLTYTMTVSNSGPQNATGVTLIDTLPAGVIHMSSTPSQGTCSVGSTTVVCQLGGIEDGQSATVDIVVTPQSAGAIVNDASVDGNEHDPIGSNNSATETTTVTDGADLSVTKTDSADPVLVGGSFSYTATVSNSGPEDATAVTLTDNLPAGLAYDSATPSQGTCSEASGAVTCDLGAVAAGQGATVEIAVTAQSAGTITNELGVEGAEPDPNEADNSTSETTTVVEGADLSVTKTDSIDPVAVGQTFSYTATVTNGGPDSASDVTLTDQLPAGVGYESATPSQGTCGEASGTVTCDLGSLAEGAGATVEISVTAQETGTITNSVSVDGAELDSDNSNNSASEDTTVRPGADLSVTKTDSADPVLVGGSLTYTATVSNAGPEDATGVTLTDNLPAGLAYDSATPSQGICSETTGTVSCDVGTLASGESATVEIAVTAQSAGAHTNTATAHADEPDPDAADNSAAEQTTVVAGTDLSITQSDSTDPVLTGGQITYTATVTNNGADDATGVTLTDTLPTGPSYDSATPSQGSCNEASGTVTCDLGALANGESASVELTVTAPTAGTLSNDASADASELDPNNSNNSSSETTTVSDGADLSVTQTDSPDPVATGDQVTYTATVSNGGPDDATNVALTDNLPAGTSYDSATPSQGSCNEASGTVTCDLGSLANGESATVELRVTAQAPGTITNAASVDASELDQDGSNDSSSEQTTVNGRADLSVAQTDSPDPVLTGHGLTYTATVSNDGPDDATGVTLTDILPAAAAYGSATPSQGDCNEASGTLTCDLGTIANGDSATVEVTVTPQAAGTISNELSVAGDQHDGNGSNDSASESTTVTDGANLSVTKTDSADPVLVGDSFTYTATVTNSGPEDATNVTLTDSLPAAVAYDSATRSQGTCNEASGTVTCDLGALANGESATVEIAVTAQTAGTVTNNASVTATELDADDSDNSAGEQTTIVAGVDLSVTQADSPDPVMSGHQITYTATVSNDGPDDATNVALTDNLPAGTSYDSATSSQGSCNEASGIVTCDLGSLAGGASATVEIAVTPQSAGTVTNTASVDGDQLDSDNANNSASEDTTVRPGANLSVTKTDSADPVLVGDSFTYTATVTNSGPEDATNVTLTDTLPAGVAYDSATPSQGTCNESAGTVTCDLDTIANGQSATVEIAVTGQSAGTVVNTAGVQADEPDPDAADNSATEQTTLVAGADISVSQTDSPDPVLTGGQITYTATVTNNGADDATGVTLTDTLPTGPSYDSATPSQGSCNEASGTVTCDLGALANDESASVELTVTAPTAGTLSNDASADATELDPDNSNNSSSETTTVSDGADLSVTQTDSPDPVLTGDELTYTATVTNGGPQAATGVTLTDNLPSGVTYNSATPSQGTCNEASGTVTCDLGTLANGASATVELKLTPQTAGTITNEASVDAIELDSDNSNNSSSEDTTVVQPQADLAVSKTDSADPVLVGSSFTYTATVTNSGPEDATNVTLTDTLPAGVAYDSATPSQGTCNESAGTVTCDLDTIANGQSATVEIAVTGQSAGTVVNTAGVQADEPDPDAADNSATEETTLVAGADISVSQTDSPDPVLTGGQITYTATVTNNGADDATGVTLTDTLPTGPSYDSATPSQGSCNEASGTVTCDLGALANDESASVELTVTAPTAGTLSNDASADASELDPDNSNNSSSETTTVSDGADLSVTQTDSPDPVLTGDELTYTATVTNGGPQAATGVTLTDNLPSGVTYNSATPSQGTCNEASGTVTCDLGTLANGASATVELKLTPQTAGTITNEASVDAIELDSDNSNNSSSEDTTVVQPQADLAVSKTDSADPVLVGSSFTYTATVTNSGPEDATNVTLTDTLPAGVAYDSATPSQGTCNESAGTVTCDLDTITNGQSATVEIAVTGQSAGTVVNTAGVQADEPDPDAADNSATEETTLVAGADISVSQTDSPDPVLTGGQITYTATVTNNGADDATGVTLTDTLPTGPSYDSATPSQGSCNEASGTVTCDLGALANDESASVELTVTAPTAGTLSNDASADASELDPDNSNNSSSETTTVSDGADLSVTQTDSPDPALTGDQITYSATVSNAGPDDANGVTFSDTLPAAATYDTATPSQGTCNESSGTVTCDLGTLASAQSATVEVKVTAPTAATLTNAASVQASGLDSDNSNNSSSEDTTVNARADLSVTQTDSPDPVLTGHSLTYTATVSNDGPQDATGVTLTDTLPAAVTYDSASPSQGTCNESSGTVTCALGTIANGATATVDITVTPQSAGSITNEVSVDGDQHDADGSDNSAGETTTVTGGADLSIMQTDSPDPVLTGDELTYTATVTNGGPQAATGVTLTDNLPSGVTYNSATPSQGTCNESSGTVTCDLGTIANGDSATVDLKVTPQDAGSITNEVSVDTSEIDPDGSGNSATESTTVEQRRADLSVTATDSPDPVLVGEELTYTATVDNGGPQDATDVTLTDTLPAAVTYGSATPSQGTCNESSGTVTCDLGTIANGQSATVDVVVRPQNAGTISNDLAVDGAEQDPDGANNTTSDATTVNEQPFEHPQAASSLSVSLLPAFRQTISATQCAARGGSLSAHGAPLAFASCDPPGYSAGTKAHLGPQASGSATFGVIPGNLGTPADEADLSFDFNLSDVQPLTGTGDYLPNAAGPDVTLIVKFRLSDTSSGPSHTDPATVADFEFEVPSDCAATAGPEGSICEVTTTANALTPGAIKEGRHMVMQAYRVRVNDAGQNGTPGNSDDRVIAQQGVYIP